MYRWWRFGMRGRLGKTSQREIILPGSFRRAGEPIVMNRLVGCTGNFITITLDKPTILAEDNQRLSLSDDQIAIARDQIPPCGAEGFLQLNWGFTSQSGRLIEHMDLATGWPVDPVAGK